jgi:hypothetical protein
MPPCLMCWVRFFSGWVKSFGFESDFFGLRRVLDKNHGPYPGRGLLRVKNYDMYMSVASIGSVGLGFFGWVRSGGS